MNQLKDKLPIFTEYSQLEGRLPWIQLGKFPTPVEQLTHLNHPGLWIKRDDISSALYGGNKVRKLEFSLAQILSKKKKQVVTIGGIGTNHGLATAIFCQQLGLKCTLLLFRQPVTRLVKQNLKLFHYYGAELVFKGSLLNTALHYGLFQRFVYPWANFLYAGGSSVEGTIGFVNAAFELKAQIDDGLLPEPDLIFCPLGTNGTLVGLNLGVRLAGLKSRVVGVRITSSKLGPLNVANETAAGKLMKAVYKRLKAFSPDCPTIKLNAPEILHQYMGDGYGHPTEQGREACQRVKENENITLDPVYTSKTFAAVLEYCSQPANTNQNILYWHTYNSIDLSQQADSVDYLELPQPLHRFFQVPEVYV